VYQNVANSIDVSFLPNRVQYSFIHSFYLNHTNGHSTHVIRIEIENTKIQMEIEVKENKNSYKNACGHNAPHKLDIIVATQHSMKRISMHNSVK